MHGNLQHNDSPYRMGQNSGLVSGIDLGKDESSRYASSINTMARQSTYSAEQLNHTGSQPSHANKATTMDDVIIKHR